MPEVKMENHQLAEMPARKKLQAALLSEGSW